ncbi:MAG: hypothetical protein CSYNP_02960 [Syntrophus sp. SKADARSKE-3]|nr:hypothetical protein [Syntrophus sp. SKADARSKE-3]
MVVPLTLISATYARNKRYQIPLVKIQPDQNTRCRVGSAHPTDYFKAPQAITRGMV